MTIDYRHHSELAKAKVRAEIAAINQALDNLIGWAETAGFDFGEMSRARGIMRREYNKHVVGHEESEQG